MHRMALFAIAVLLLLVAAEIRLSRGDNNYSEPPPPDLWEHAQPPVVGPHRWSSARLVERRSPIRIRRATARSSSRQIPAVHTR